MGLALLLLMAMAMPACKDKDDDDTTPSLYERLGGISAIEAVTDQFLANVAGDARINGFFAATVQNEFRLMSLRNHLVDQICEASGGPCTYKGKDMKTAHQGLGIDDDDFNALVEDLVASLDQFNVPQTEQTELLTVLASLKPDIVEN